MTKTEEQTIRNILARLRQERLGCAEPFSFGGKPDERQADGYEGVSRVYVNTSLIGPLELLLPENRDPKLAMEISRK